MKNIELLAPAGSMESLYAAVINGADAVYLGGNKFSARAYASNFDEEEMEKAVDYCHTYDVKVYVTINTLLKEQEINEAALYAKFLYKIGVDALIIQDTGLINILRKELPDFELHGSTQMTIHNGEGALFFTKEGLKRIVLSRELSFNEVQYISKSLGIETEIFVHGALCICYSGQCLMSSLIGGRSGNRGRCAQPCRLPYTIIDKVTGEEKKGYLLSPKDICFFEDVDKVLESGTSSLKIEGRMKRAEYVAGVVSAYRKAIDKSNYNKEKEKKKLLKLFNREGFSKAYFKGNEGANMMAYSYPKNTGIKIGKAMENGYVVLEEEISLGDGIRVYEKGFILSKILKDNREVEVAFKGDTVKLFPQNYRKGEELYKTSDKELLSNLSDTYSNPYVRKIPLQLQVNFKLEEKISLTVSYKGISITKKGEVVKKALKKPVEKEKIIENLNKTGNTPFKFDNIYFDEFEEGFIPISSINEIRREILEELLNKIIKKYKREEEHIFTSLKEENLKSLKVLNKTKEPIIVVNTKEQLKAALEFGFENICTNVFYRKNDISLDYLREKEIKVILAVPNIIKEEFEYVDNLINKYSDVLSGILTSNIGIINRFKKRIKIIGDYKLNVFNSSAVDFYSKYLEEVPLSIELNKNEIKEILNNTNVKCTTLIYGKIETMVSEYCPIGSVFGNKGTGVSCNKPCERGEFYLKDRMGAEFNVLTDKYCRSHIYNNVPLNLIDSLDFLNKFDNLNFRLDFIDESYEEVIKVLKAYRSKKWEYEFKDYTRGHFRRGVE